ncbi:MAG TPA: hypothetical protein VF313_10245, partial [Anaerolineaceae bacterium]
MRHLCRIFAATTMQGVPGVRRAEELLAAHTAGKVRVAIGRASNFFGEGALDSSAGERIFGPAVA